VRATGPSHRQANRALEPHSLHDVCHAPMLANRSEPLPSGPPPRTSVNAMREWGRRFADDLEAPLTRGGGDILLCCVARPAALRGEESMNRTNSAVAVTALLAACIGIRSEAGPPQMRPVAPAVPGGVSADTLGPPDPGRPSNSLSGWTCAQQSSCPEGLLLLDGDGNHKGCIAEAFFRTTCAGSCTTCAGVQATTKVCVTSGTGTCDIPPAYRQVSCGNKRAHANACTSNKPSGMPDTPNGCYCDTSITFSYEIDSCVIAECS